MRDFGSLQPGHVLAGKYRIEGVLGRGAMGAVLAAKHIELGHDVAIKIILPGGLDVSSVVLERFFREGRVAARLSSPHVARVHDVGRLPEGSPYLVMELVRGWDLKTILEQGGPQPFARVAAWGRQIADALGEAHALGIVHRDVKPANVMLAENVTGRRMVKVLDFGVSKLGSDVDAKKLTGTAVAVGSPAYMSPEQIASSKGVDGRADIWALGVVLYELTTGRIPFDGQTVHDIVMGICAREHVPPSQLVRGIPSAFDTVIAQCLRKRPEERFASMAELEAALRPLSEDVLPPAPLRPPTSMPPMTTLQAAPAGEGSPPAASWAPRGRIVETSSPITMTGGILAKVTLSSPRLVAVVGAALVAILVVVGVVALRRHSASDLGVENGGSASTTASPIVSRPATGVASVIGASTTSVASTAPSTDTVLVTASTSVASAAPSTAKPSPSAKASKGTPKTTAPSTNAGRRQGPSGAVGSSEPAKPSLY